jgi:tetratricopeptide (TPR) repeat protein
MFRLARAANALKGEADYHSYMTTLVGLGALAEAKAVHAEAAAAPNVDMTKTQFKDIAAKTSKAPTRAAIEAQAKAASTPAAMIAAGDALYGVGAYAEAAAQYRAALAKGGDANLANLHLGMALARSGDKAGAATALKAVGGNQQVIAQYWLMYVGG